MSYSSATVSPFTRAAEGSSESAARVGSSTNSAGSSRSRAPRNEAQSVTPSSWARISPRTCSHRAAEPALVGMHRLAGEQRVGQGVQRRGQELLGDLSLDELGLGLQVEAEVGEAPGDGQPLMPPGPANRDRRRAPGAMPPDQVVRKGGSLDPRTGDTEP